MAKTLLAFTISILYSISKNADAARWWDDPEPDEIPDFFKGPENLLIFTLIAFTILIHNFVENHCKFIKSYKWLISFLIGFIATKAIPLIVGEAIGVLTIIVGIVLYIPTVLPFLSPWIFAACFFIGLMALLNGDTKIFIASIAVASLTYGLFKISVHIHEKDEDED